MAEKVLGRKVVGLACHPGEEHLNADCYSHAQNHPKSTLPKSRVNPLQGWKVKHGIGPAKDHAHDDENDAWLVHCLVQSQIVVGVLLEVWQALAFLVIRIHDPVLWHCPGCLERVKVDNKENKQAQTEEKEVKLACTTASHAEPRA